VTRKRILYLIQLNPWPLNSGGLIRNYWLVRALGDVYDVDLVTADRPAAAPADFAACCASITSFARPEGWRRTAARAAGALHPGGSLFTSSIVTRAMRDWVRDRLRSHDYHAVVADLTLVKFTAHAAVECRLAGLRAYGTGPAGLPNHVAKVATHLRAQPLTDYPQTVYR